MKTEATLSTASLICREVVQFIEQRLKGAEGKVTRREEGKLTGSEDGKVTGSEESKLTGSEEGKLTGLKTVN